MSPELLTGLLLGAIMAAAVRFDLATRRIPNSLCLTGAVLGLGLSVSAQGGGGLVQGMGGLAAAALILLPLYAAGGMGAGDVKLMGAAGAWLGIEGAVFAAALALVLGGLLAVALLIAPGRRRKLPFAPAIALGSLLTYAAVAVQG
jgi:prepilin peptidase CpaA